MKKILIWMLVLTLLAATFVGCTPAEDEEPADDPVVESPEDDEEDEEDEAPVGEAGSIASFGLGQNIDISKSVSAEDDKTAQAQADVTIAAVGFDEEGKVASVTIDVAQTRVAYDEDMEVTSDLEAEVPSKVELGDDYGMRGASGIDAEWFEQAEALENWMIGKTVEEITGMAVEDGISAEEDLTSSVTISVGSYLEAVEEAWENREDVAGAETVGLGIQTSIAKSRSAEGDTTAQAQVDTTMTATAFDADGNVAGAQVDVAQVRVAFDEDGQVTSDLEADIKTKQELKEDYGMVGNSEIEKEWFEQMAALEEWMVGKSVDEITGMPVKEVDDSHLNVPDVEELTSSVTITVESYLEVVEEASNNAR